MLRARTIEVVRALALPGLMLLAPQPLGAHEGPPYAILVDQIAGPAKLSVWADPDVGSGTFLIYLEPISARLALPESCTVDLFVRPASGRLAETSHRAEPQRTRKGLKHYEAHVPFDRAEPWQVRVQVASPRGSGQASTQVEVTPPGHGAVLDFVFYLFPFVAVAFLFVMAVWRGRKP